MGPESSRCFFARIRSVESESASGLRRSKEGPNSLKVAPNYLLTDGLLPEAVAGREHKQNTAICIAQPTDTLFHSNAGEIGGPIRPSLISPKRGALRLFTICPNIR